MSLEIALFATDCFHHANLAGTLHHASLIQFGVDYYLHRLAIPPVDVFYLPGWMISAILGVALLESLLVGLAPARRAARIEPIEALQSA